jgi:hypothetical protein
LQHALETFPCLQCQGSTVEHLRCTRTFKKKHEDSSSARKQKAGATKRQTRLSESMHSAGSQGIRLFPQGRALIYALSENEKVLSSIARWATYAIMKVSQAVLGDPLLVVMLQAARGPHATKGLVPTLTRSVFKGFMVAEFQVTCPCIISCHMLLLNTY